MQQISGGGGGGGGGGDSISNKISDMDWSIGGYHSTTRSGVRYDYMHPLHQLLTAATFTHCSGQFIFEDFILGPQSSLLASAYVQWGGVITGAVVIQVPIEIHVVHRDGCLGTCSSCWHGGLRINSWARANFSTLRWYVRDNEQTHSCHPAKEIDGHSTNQVNGPLKLITKRLSYGTICVSVGEYN